MKPQRALVPDLDAAGGCGSRCRATDVEGAHRQLRARLADRLRGDHADRLADVDQPAPREVSAVAHATHAIARATGDWRAHAHLVDALVLEEAHQALIDQRAG